MKYIVECEKKTKCLFVVDASDEELCDKKLRAGQYEKKLEIVETTDTYLGYEYKSHEKYSGKGDEAVICSIEDLCRELGTEPDHLERYMFKETENGLPISWNDDGVTVSAYAEGANCDGPSATMLFPFVMREFNNIVSHLEQVSDEMWHEWNDDDEGDE